MAARTGTPGNSSHAPGGRGPTLTWPGRQWRVGEPHGAPSPLEDLELFGAPSQNRLVFGDSLDVARALAVTGLRGKVDLIYVDPPFASQADYHHEARLDGPADGRVRRTPAYSDSWHSVEREAGSDGVGAYLDMLAPRLEAMAALLAPHGTLWVHLDWRASYLVRVLLDEVLGRKRFLNEVVWRRAPNLGRQAASGQFGRTLDSIVVYGGPEARLTPPTRLAPIPASSVKYDAEGRPFTTAPRGDYTDASMRRLEGEGRVHTSTSGRQYVKYFLEPNTAGELCRERRIDTLWDDVPPLRHAAVSERTGYPTQKPRALLERIVRCATEEAAIVVDLFAGSGTTGEVAHALGRTFVLADVSPVAINTARARLLRASASFGVAACGDRVVPDAGPAEVTVTSAGDEVRVALAHPEEPLGWAVGAAAKDSPFTPVWHSERQPGSVPVRAAVEARLTLREPLDIRVYGDDGSVAHALRAVPARPNERDRLSP